MKIEPKAPAAVKLPDGDVRRYKRKKEAYGQMSIDSLICERGHDWYVWPTGQIRGGCHDWADEAEALMHYTVKNYVTYWADKFEGEYCGDSECCSCHGSRAKLIKFRSALKARCIQRIKWLEERRKRWPKTMKVNVGK